MHVASRRMGMQAGDKRILSRKRAEWRRGRTRYDWKHWRSQRGGTELTGGRERQHPSRMTLDGRKGAATLAAAWEGEAGGQKGSAKGGKKRQAGGLQPGAELAGPAWGPPQNSEVSGAVAHIRAY